MVGRRVVTRVITFIAFWLLLLLFYFIRLTSVSKDIDLNLNNNPTSDARHVAWKKFDVESYLGPKRLRPGEDAYSKNKFNQAASDALSPLRNIPDTRHYSCSQKSYTDVRLPNTSVIITFHNEARSTLLRTIFSVFQRSPAHLIAEIILIDDFSDDPSDGFLLSKIYKVRLLRNARREGLVRSRVFGADMARGEVLTFLDSHVECNTGWLEPLLHRVAGDRTRVVSPIIDVVSMDNFDYIAAASELKGGFSWNLVFKWDFLTPKEREARGSDPVAPIKTPIIAGGLFSVNRLRFAEIGKYDMKMDVWGAENLEISIRIWTCHGSLEIIPCSRVGHVFRRQHPYSFPGGGSSLIFARNTRRAAAVWLDGYSKYYLTEVPLASYVDYGDISDRLALRKQLQCRSFRWFLTNVYPELKVPGGHVIEKGSISQGSQCLDTLSHLVDQPVGLYQCHNTPGGNQDFSLLLTGQVMHNKLCLSPTRFNNEARVMLHACNEASKLQVWEKYKQNMLRVANSNYCLDSSTYNTDGLYVRSCNPQNIAQHWTLSMKPL